MSTELKPAAGLGMTRFSGGAKLGVCLQLTQLSDGPLSKKCECYGYVALTKADAVELAIALLEFATDKRPVHHD